MLLKLLALSPRFWLTDMSSLNFTMTSQCFAYNGQRIWYMYGYCSRLWLVYWWCCEKIVLFWFLPYQQNSVKISKLNHFTMKSLLTWLPWITHAINVLMFQYIFSETRPGNNISFMMTSSNGNIFRVTGHLCGEFTGRRWIPHKKASDAERWCFFHLCPNKRLSKQSWGWWFETPSHPLWRHCNDYMIFFDSLEHWWIALGIITLMTLFTIVVCCVIHCKCCNKKTRR